ncbi:MAG: S41 family peptidase [Paludibacteraceae bacterium]
MKKYWVPLVVAVSMAVGVIIGGVYTIRHKVLTDYEQLAGFNVSSGNKIVDMLRLIDNMYVDSVRSDSISEAIVPLIVKQLDPHSAYIPAADLASVNEQLEGTFSGIGVQFSLQNDTVYVVDVIAGGPSERAGLLDGDRIVEVNDTAFVGKQLTNEKVMKKLRGPKNSKVRVGIVRRNTSDLLHFDITRGDIPVHSVDAAYMITPETGYIAVNKFGANTYNEFLTALAKLQKAHARNVIVDLRGNVGGYMNAALDMLNEFLSKNDLMVYVEGRSYPREESRANGYGNARNMKIAVLLDEWSASASEIFAGAIQDNDRGIIVGRRSFGKGLVQNQFGFADGSAVRLTVARYYTPSGRCIQKPYERGNAEDYETDLLNRYLHGEFFSQDSIHQSDTAIYRTKGGREVHGGGGIMPDIFVPRDTTGVSPYFNRLVNGAYLYRFALDYSERQRTHLATFNDWKSLVAYLQQQNLYDQVIEYAAKNGVSGSETDKQVSRTLILRHVTSYIVRNMLGDEGFFPYINSYDTMVDRAVQELEK